MVPKNALEFEDYAVEIVLTRIYGDVSALATRQRISEADIAAFERRVIDEFGEPNKFADEFRTFEVEPAHRRALDRIRLFCERGKAIRAEKV